MNDSVDYEATWKVMKLVFPILDDSFQLEDKPFLKHEFNEVVTFVNNNKIAQDIQNLIVIKLQKKLREEIVPEFWSYFKNVIPETNNFQQFYNAIKCIYDNYRLLDHIMQKLNMFKQATHLESSVYNEECAHSALKLMLRATMLSQLSSDYQQVVMHFYECALKMEDIEEINDGNCTVCSQDNIHCNCLYLFQETNRYSFLSVIFSHYSYSVLLTAFYFDLTVHLL